MSSCDISDLASQKIPEDKIPVEYITGLKEKERTLCLRASLICLEVMDGAQVPCGMQLCAVIADQKGVDCPRSGPGSVWALFADPGPGHEYCGVLINNN